MKILIHDLDEKIVLNESIDFNDFNINPCIGCFSCWFKSPKMCIHNDSLKTIGNLILNSTDIIIISKCIYGTYSSHTKKILERCIGYVEPFFEIRNKHIRHKVKNKDLNLHVFFYGNCLDESKTTAERLVKNNAQNFHAKLINLKFLENEEKVRECLHDMYH